jgi:hypothetical protein
VAITTLAEVKQILNITTTEKDDWITNLIPKVEDDYAAIRNRSFDIGTKVKVETLGLPADEDLGLTIGDDYYVIALKKDYNAHEIAYKVFQQMLPSVLYDVSIVNASSSSADLRFTEKFPAFQENFSVVDLSVDASANFDTTVTTLQTFYPDGSGKTAAQMINHQMADSAGVQSESLGDYSVSYTEAGAAGYPKSVTSSIKRFVVMQ